MNWAVVMDAIEEDIGDVLPEIVRLTLHVREQRVEIDESIRVEFS
jgi:hypothetical protein